MKTRHIIKSFPQVINLTLIGKGTFSRVYQFSAEKILIVSCDPFKEALALWAIGDHVPALERVDYDGDCKSLYTCPKYTKVTAPKKQLKPEHYHAYKLLRGITIPYNINPYDRYSWLYGQFKALDIREGIRDSLLSMLDSVSNYSHLIGFEISPRNIAIDNLGDLILLDVFFDIKTLREVTGEK